MGRVHLARSASGRLVAVKTVHRHLAADETFRERFRREVRAARGVRGPYTAAVLDADCDAEEPWLAAEFCPGPTLGEVVEAQGPLGGADAASLGAALAEALAAAAGGAAAPGLRGGGDGGGDGKLVTSGRLYAYGADGGRKRWERPSTGPETGWPTGLGGLSAPVVADGLLLHWRDPGTLEAVDLAGGRVRWSRALDGVARLPPAVSGATVYAAHGDACTALRLGTGEPRRTWRLPGQLTGLGADRAGWYAAVGTTALHAYNAHTSDAG
ncbi:PQQ-binding-like beta-propeller repeat protein [Streptomyces synnematoformans]|uniref:Pyrrolo-quinoline quinone repeat domain-containing protein n=1 Tax=Streptomyces synnematoformans TaxID=415721 RepID=A0ABN2Y6W0_9ACTN